MKDLNFFSIYQGSNREKRDEKVYFYIAAGVLVGVIFITLTINIVKILLLNSSIKDYTEKLNKSEVQSQLKEAEDVNNKIDMLSQYEGSLSNVAKSIKNNDVVNDELLNDICNAMPGAISFKDFNIQAYDMKISGVSKTREAVGEFEHNLTKLSKIKNVHVDSITKSNAVGEDYSFEITCVLKEVK